MTDPLPLRAPVSQPFPDSAGAAAAWPFRRSPLRLIPPPAVLLALALVFPGAEPAGAGQRDITPLPPAGGKHRHRAAELFRHGAGDGRPVPRARYFGNAAAGTGHLDDFDSDRLVNLLEFAFGTHPAGGRSGDGEGGADGGGAGVNSGPDALRYSGSLTEGGGTLIATGQPVPARLEGGTLTALFIHRKDRTRTGLEYTPQFTPDPSAAAAWTVITATPKVLAEDGLYEVVSVPLPAPAEAAGFFRVGVEGAGRR